ASRLPPEDNAPPRKSGEQLQESPSPTPPPGALRCPASPPQLAAACVGHYAAHVWNPLGKCRRRPDRERRHFSLAPGRRCARPNGPWNQFHICDLGTRAGGWDSPPRQPPAHMTTLPWPRFVGGAFFRARVDGKLMPSSWRSATTSLLLRPSTEPRRRPRRVLLWAASVRFV